MRREAAALPQVRGFGRCVEPDAHMLDPHLSVPSQLVTHSDQRSVAVSWARTPMQGLHSTVIEYTPDEVRVGVRIGTRPAFAGQPGAVVVRMVIEHTVVRLREPLRGRRVAMLRPERALTGTS